MKDQVTTIEQSQRLMALGVPAEKASMCWVKDPNGNEYNLAVHDEFCYEMACFEPVPAYTVANLLTMMPWEIEVKNSVLPKLPGLRLNDSEDTPFRFNVRKAGVSWICKYTSYGIGEIDGIFDESRSGVNLIDPTCELIEWLVSNGYKLEV